MHQGGAVRLHSLETILSEGKLYDAPLGSFIPEHGIVGAAGVGLPINIKLEGRSDAHNFSSKVPTSQSDRIKVVSLFPSLFICLLFLHSLFSRKPSYVISSEVH